MFDGAEEMSDLPERRGADLRELVYRHDVSRVLRCLAVMQGCLAGHGESKTSKILHLKLGKGAIHLHNR